MFCCPNLPPGHSHCESVHRAYVRRPAPEFKGNSWWNNEFKEISLSGFKGKWVVLFFYPLDFTFVCPTEIVAYNDLSDEFAQNSIISLIIDAQVIACSTDSHFSHREWALKPRSEGGLNPMKIPMLSDMKRTISDSYGVLIGNDDGMGGAALRGTFIIDDKGVLRHSTINDLNAGRNVEETLRLLKAFQFADKHGEVCPAKWQPGKATMTPKHGSQQLNEFWKKEHSK